MEQALPVEYVPFDETVELTGNVSDMSVEQYLSWVRKQSSRLPSVFRADHISSSSAPSSMQTKYMPEVEAISACPSEYLPSEEWERNTLFTFSELRSSLAAKSEATMQSRTVAVPVMKDLKGWIAFCLNIDMNSSTIQADSIQTNTDVEDADISVKKRKRELAESLGIDMAMDEVQDGDIVQETINADDDANKDSNEEGERSDEEEDDGNVTVEPSRSWQGARGVQPTVPLLLQFDQVLTQRVLLYIIDYVDEFSLSTTACEWIYALLTRVEKPLHRDAVAALRQLFRRCCKLRTQLTTFEIGTPMFEESLASLNLMIAITGNYFGQDESLQNYFSDTIAFKNETMDEENSEYEDEESNMDEVSGYDGSSNRPIKLSRRG